MGAWGETVMCNDYVLDEMFELIEMNKEELRSKVKEYLTEQRRDYARYDCNRLFGAELVDISINGIDEDILGGTYDYDTFFKGLKGNLDDLRGEALKALETVRGDVHNWTDIKKRTEVINKIESRLRGKAT